MSGPIMVDIEGTTLSDEDREILKHPLTGGVILFTRNFVDRNQVRELVRDIHALKSPSLIVAVDQEGGRVQRFKPEFTVLPPMRALGQVYQRNAYEASQLCEDVGWLMGCELRDVGIDLNFAPVIDVDHGCSEVIGDRAFSSDATVVVAMAKALIGGMHSAGISGCAKHFPGHGGVTEDSHLELPTDVRDKAQIQHDMATFKEIVGVGVESMMTAHLVVPCEAEELVSFSSHWIQHILRGQLGYRGVVFSDDLSMKGAEVSGGIALKVSKALQAGCEFLPICNDREAVVTLYDSDLKVDKACHFERLRAYRPMDKSVFKTKRYKTTLNKILDLA